MCKQSCSPEARSACIRWFSYLAEKLPPGKTVEGHLASYRATIASMGRSSTEAPPVPQEPCDAVAPFITELKARKAL